MQDSINFFNSFKSQILSENENLLKSKKELEEKINDLNQTNHKTTRNLLEKLQEAEEVKNWNQNKRNTYLIIKFKGKITSNWNKWNIAEKFNQKYCSTKRY